MTPSALDRVSRQFGRREEPPETSDGDEHADADRRYSPSFLRDAITYGSIGGLVATLSMTIFRMPTSKSLPPTAEFWATYVGGGEPEDYPLVALALHLLYGIGGGVAYALVVPGRGDSEAAAEAKSALFGTVFGTALSVFGSRVVLTRILGVDPDRDELLVFHISHVVYGLTLGTWVGSRVGREE